MAKSNDSQYTYFADATAKCTNCGSIYKFGSTIENLTVEICGNCHPFYTGKEVLVDTAGRIEKFQAKMTQVSTAEKKSKTKSRKTVQNIGDLMTDDSTGDETQEAPKATKSKMAATPMKAPVIDENEAKAKTEVKVETKTPNITDDLTKIEGIGPVAAKVLVDNGINTFALLASTPADTVKEFLNSSESKVQHLDPTSWAQQSQLAADGKFDELKTLQDELMGGKEVA
jgi:ribosomal protein L31